MDIPLSFIYFLSGAGAIAPAVWFFIDRFYKSQIGGLQATINSLNALNSIFQKEVLDLKEQAINFKEQLKTVRERETKFENHALALQNENSVLKEENLRLKKRKPKNDPDNNGPDGPNSWMRR